MTTFQVYWLTRLDPIHSLLEALACVIAGGGLLALFVLLLSATIGENEEHFAYIKKVVAYCSLGILLSGGASCLVPTTNELVSIYGISYLTTNKDAREIPAEALKVLNQKLKEMGSKGHE